MAYVNSGDSCIALIVLLALHEYHDTLFFDSFGFVVTGNRSIVILVSKLIAIPVSHGSFT